jgi:hypothetical protein
MASPFAGSNSLSATGSSSGIGLDPTARTTMVLIDVSGLIASTSTQSAADVIIQGTLDVFTSTYSGTSSASVLWGNISTSHFSSASTQAAVITIATPIAGLRLSSTTYTSGTVNLKALQGILS